MKNILVFLETNNNTLKRVSFEVITAGKNIADKTGAKLVGVIVNGNNDVINSAKEFGLTEVVNAKSDKLSNHSSKAVAELVAQVAKSESSDCVIFPANAAGLELGPRVAVKLEAGYISDCIALEVESDNITAKKPVYAGKALLKTQINTNVKVFSIRPNVFTAVAAPAGSLNIKDFAPNLSDKDFTVSVKNVAKNEGKLDVLEADAIISGGRGIKAPENYNLIEDLAKVLGAAVGASRAVVDAGWRPHSEQVGQTGKTVSPTLYVACGISGAVQHLAGMSSSKVIVAINKDKDAPIFKVCDYGIIGDLFEVMPKLTNKLKATLGK